VAGRDTSCKESIALQYPSSSLMRNPSSSSTCNVSHPNNCTLTYATTQGNSHMFLQFVYFEIYLQSIKITGHNLESITEEMDIDQNIHSIIGMLVAYWPSDV
jgi:hypothetical protein